MDARDLQALANSAERAFARGLSRRLESLHGFGVTCVCLQPFYPTPDRDNDDDVTGVNHPWSQHARGNPHRLPRLV